MKVAYLHGGSYSGDASKKGSGLIFVHWDDPSCFIEAIGSPKRDSIQSKFIVALWQVLHFLPSLKNYDAIITMGIMRCVFFSFFRRLLGNRIPWIAWIEEPAMVLNPLRRRILWKLITYSLSTATSIVCYCQYQCSFWRERLKPSVKVYRIRFPVGMNPPTSLPYNDYIFSGGKWHRDYSTLIAAAKEVDAKFIICTTKNPITGENPLEGIPLPPNVSVFWDRSPSEFAEILSASKFAIIPLKSNLVASGVYTYLNCISNGKAMIATKTVATMDYVVDGETGILVEFGNVTELKEKILYLLQHPEEVERLSKNTRRFGEQELSPQKWVEEVKKVIYETYKGK